MLKNSCSHNFISKRKNDLAELAASFIEKCVKYLYTKYKMENDMNDKIKCDFGKERSNEVELVASNLEAILQSSTYKLAHEDLDLLNTDEMRGVRMLLEITKPEQVIEKENIISTVMVLEESIYQRRFHPKEG